MGKTYTRINNNYILHLRDKKNLSYNQTTVKNSCNYTFAITVSSWKRTQIYNQMTSI